MTVETYVKEKERRIKEMKTLPMGGGEVTRKEDMEALYASVRSSGIEEEYVIPFTDWEGVEEYWDPVETTSLQANFTAVFLELASLLNYYV